MRNKTIRVLLTVFVLSWLVCCKDKSRVHSDSKQDKVEVSDNNHPRISFTKTFHSFGKIHKSHPGAVTFDFTFTNTGEQPVVIKKVDVSCGCLSASYSNYPVKKDSTGFIRVKVNPEFLNGSFNKSVFVTSNSVSKVDLLKVRGVIY